MNGHALFKFRLYVAGSGLNSARAISNLNALCKTYLHDRYAIEVVDVYTEPERALADAIMMTPTLVKLAPIPRVTIVGTLCDIPTVLHALGLDPIAL